MTNPFVHTLVFIAAVLIPGGLLVYFAWRATRKAISLKSEPNHTAQKQGLDDIPEILTDPDDALAAFRRFYPKYPPDSLRAQNRSRRLQAYKTKPRKKSQ